MSDAVSTARRRIAVITGTRAEYGLLRPVMRAIAARPELELNVLVTGCHLLPPQNTIEEVRSEFAIAATVPMQSPNHDGRIFEAEALGRGITGFAEIFAQEKPDVVVVLGDRIEAFAAAAAASVAGIRVAHIHGGDRAEGIADEAIRHAITKLAHIHFPATQNSALRIIAIGEDPARVHIVGSPAIDELSEIAPLPDSDFEALGKAEIIMLLHPCGDPDEVEYERARELLRLCRSAGRTLALHPNHDPGCRGILRAIDESGCASCAHLPRPQFIGLLRRAKALVGNSSAGLIECAAIPARAINIGRRQSGRETPSNATSIPEWDYQTIQSALTTALSAAALRPADGSHPYGDGHAGPRVAEALAHLDLQAHPLVKRNTY